VGDTALNGLDLLHLGKTPDSSTYWSRKKIAITKEYRNSVNSNFVENEY